VKTATSIIGEWFDFLQTAKGSSSATPLSREPPTRFHGTRKISSEKCFCWKKAAASLGAGIFS